MVMQGVIIPPPLIEEINIRQILDSRGNPTVEVEVTSTISIGIASAPAGASRGKYEVIAESRRGLTRAIEFYRTNLIPRLEGIDVRAQRDIDKILHEVDNTPNFGKLGGNLAIATSIACAKAGANALRMPLYFYLGGVFAEKLPRPLGNVLGGGKHAIGGTDIQEFLVFGIGGATVTESIITLTKVHKRVGEKLKKLLPTATAIGKGDEGAWVAKVSNTQAFEIVAEAINEIADETKCKLRFGVDFAASELYRQNKYHYQDISVSKNEQIDYVTKLIDDYNLYIVEDPLEQNDFQGYAELTASVGSDCLIVGDDLFVTSAERLLKGINEGACNAILIKPNQVGTLTDTFTTVKLAHENKYKTIISHRSGETTDDAIVHLGIAFGCYAIKTGIVGGERIAKLNELIRLEEELRSRY